MLLLSLRHKAVVTVKDMSSASPTNTPQTGVVAMSIDHILADKRPKIEKVSFFYFGSFILDLGLKRKRIKPKRRIKVTRRKSQHITDGYQRPSCVVFSLILDF